MFSGKDSSNPSFPTQWALNPTAYQNVDTSHVDWAALAQQWIAMKEAAAIVAAPPPPKMDEEGEAPMEVENPDSTVEPPAPPTGADWNQSGNSWDNSWNQWGWGWPGPGAVDSKITADSAMAIAPLMDGYSVPQDPTTLPGYTSSNVPAPTFQHGYWTAPQVPVEQSSRSSSSSRDKRSSSKNRDSKTRSSRVHREKLPPIQPLIEPVVMPSSVSTPGIDAAKRRQLPAWIREGLEKMEREKQKAIEREQEIKAREEAEKEKKRLEEEELERLKAAAGGAPVPPPKSKFESDSESEEADKEEDIKSQVSVKEEEKAPASREIIEEPSEPQLVKKSREEIMQEVMLAVRRSLTEILLEVTDQEIESVSQEELARYNALQASRLNAMKASKSKAFASIASGLGLGAYESSSEESGDEEEQNDVSDQQLQELIKRKRLDFERTSREIEAEVRRAEREEDGIATPDRPLRSRSSATPPPPLNSGTPDKMPERRLSNDKNRNHKSNDRVDGIRRLDSIPEEKTKKINRTERTPSPINKNCKDNHKEDSTNSSSDSDEDSSSSNSASSESETEVKVETKQVKKRKRKSSSSSESPKKSKKQSKDKSYRNDEKSSRSSKTKHYDEYDRTEKKSKRKDSYYDRHKSSRSRDYEKSHKDKYRDDSEERPRKRSRRSRSTSYESRSGRTRDRSSERTHKRSYDRDSTKRERSYDKSYDRYERSRDKYDRRRSRSGSRTRHRR